MKKTDMKHLLKLKDELAKLDWYDRSIFELYVTKGLSYTDLSKELNINRNSLFNTVYKVRKRLAEAKIGL